MRHIMIFMMCQWATFDEWLFDKDNDTLRLARLLECKLWVGQPGWTSQNKTPNTANDYLWLPLFISSFGQEIIEAYANALTLYGAATFQRWRLVKAAKVLNGRASPIKWNYYANFFDDISTGNLYIRNRTR